MKYIVSPSIAYAIACLAVVLLPASEGYDTIGWKLFIGQVYAIPVLIAAAFVVYVILIQKINKNK